MSHATEFSPNASEMTRCSTDELKHKASELKQNVQDLGTQARTVAREQVQNLKDSANDYMEQGREQWDSLRSSAADYMEQGRQRALEMERTLESQIRAQPLRAVLIAAGVGMVAGILFCRR
jgi:ElaB/YqjD/DUF883 family membrane-anchored ribosome-binding protein